MMQMIMQRLCLSQRLEVCGALKNGLEGDAVGCDSFLDDRKYLCLCILKCCENGLIYMEMPEFGLLGAILD